MNLNEMLDATCTAYPKSKAIIFRDEKITYAQLREQVLIVAQAFQSLGVAKGDRIALILKNSPEFIVSYFAAVRLGAIVVPINFLLTSPEIEYIINDCKATGIIVHAKFIKTVSQALRNSSSVKFRIVAGDSGKEPGDGYTAYSALLKRARQQEKDPDKTPVSPDHMAMFIYTSGTTGKPKGVMLTHNNLLSNVASCIKMTDVTSKDRFICILPMFHSFAWLVCVLLPLRLGGRIVPIESIQPFRNIMKAVFKHKITIFAGVPQIFAALSKIPFFTPLRIFIPIRLFISGAAPLSPKVLEKFQNKFKIPLIEGYGLSEASPVVTLNPIKDLRKAGSVGVSIPGVEVSIADEKKKLHTSSTQVGEIWVRGPNVMKGYYNQPEETKEVLSKDGWLHTGDMGYIDHEGYVYIVDRKKDLIISKGFNIYPKEIEDILQLHEAVNEASVIGIPKRDSDETVIAYVILNEGTEVSEKELITYCRKHLAQYKIPKEIIFTKELPKNTLGKVLKTTLREKASRRCGVKE